MLRRISIPGLLLALLVCVACTNKKVSNPIANVDSKQPDKVLFDRAMDALKHNRFDVARISLQTLINTYPDSEFIARAKLAVADSWYAEGGSTSLAQAESEYKDFITFFPNMPEAAEAQLKIANIHYQQMEKSDRDPTHALRAEEEYRQLIMQFPDSKLVPEAKQRLLEVQEVIAEREFNVGRFYYLRMSYPAAIARLKSLSDRYPLYSKADEALYLLGQSYEGEVGWIRARKLDEGAKSRMIAEFTQKATEAYSRILTRYPMMDRADDAKARLIALHQPVPRPTKAAVAQNKAEEDSRKGKGMFGKVMRNFEKHPDVADAAKVGDPTLVDPTPMSATEVVLEAGRAAMNVGGGSVGNNTASIEIGKGAPPPDQPPPRSDNPAPTAGAAVEVVPSGASSPAGNSGPAAQPDPNELKPSAATANANELRPNVPADGAQALPSPQQVNEIQTGTQAAGGGSTQATGSSSTATSSSSSSDPSADDATVSSSKKKKKKGLAKLNPF
jgi:outer membrane protein assembly factor BamD